jgi:Zn-dependent protease
MQHHAPPPSGLSMFTLSLGRPFGIPTQIHWSFWALLIWFGGRELTGPNPSVHAAAWSMLLILAVFACIALHEYGHALAARRFGIRTLGVTLLPIGGVAMLERTPTRPLQELAVALAGPAVNLVLAPAFVGLAFALGLTVDDAGMRVRGPADFVLLLGIINVVLLVFNLIPAFPMDGGRALRAVLCLFLARGRATRLAARVGQGFAVLFAGYGLANGDLLLAVIGVFVFLACRAELLRYPPATAR